MPTSNTSILVDWLPQTNIANASRHLSPFGVICFILIVLVLIGSIMASKDTQTLSAKMTSVATSVLGVALTLWAISSIFEAKAWVFTATPPTAP